MVLANIARVDMITNEETARVLFLATGQEASADARISDGTNEVLRVRNQILAQNNTEDIVMGYDLKFTDAAFNPNVLALNDGGTVTNATSGGAFKTYTAPAIANAVSRISYTCDVWCEERDINGDISAYFRFRFYNAKGKPVGYSMKEGEFYAPEYKMRTTTDAGGVPVKVDRCAAMPPTTSTAAEVLAWTGEAPDPDPEG